jgi:hypothetical protein
MRYSLVPNEATHTWSIWFKQNAGDKDHVMSCHDETGKKYNWRNKGEIWQHLLM